MPKEASTRHLSLGQKKLASLGLQLPLFPSTSAGSLPKPSDLKELKYRVQKGFQSKTDLDRKENLSTDFWVREQEKAGFDVLVDGELSRGDMVSFFAEKIEGFTPGGLVRCYGNRYYRKPIIKKKLAWKEPLMSVNWRAVQRTTHKPLKAILTGPYTLFEWSFNEFYGSREAAIEDLTRIVRKEVEQLADAGAKIIQLDEPAISSRPEDFPLFAEAIRKITHNISSYFILHHCYADLSQIWPKMLRLPVDNFYLETSNSHFKFLNLFKKFPTKKDLTLGVIESHYHEIESPQVITERIQKILRVVPENQLWLGPDCGLKTRSLPEAQAKLKVLLQGILKARKK